MSEFNVKPGDIFRFYYSEKERQKRFEPTHCFDGQLVAYDNGGSIWLCDSYWLHQFKPSGDRAHPVEKWQEWGELTFVCNLNEVEKCSDVRYFKESDVFDISYQHGCYKFLAVRKGAQRDQDAMRKAVQEKIREHRSKLESAVRNLEMYAVIAHKIENGQLDIWLP